MKKSLILLTSTFPYSTGEAFLETELPYLSENFYKVIIVPTKECSLTNHRSIPENCVINTSILLKKNNESRLKRLISKIWLSIFFSFFYKELVQLFPNRLTFKTIDELLTFSRDAILTKKALTQIVRDSNLTKETGLIYTYWCYGTTLGATLLSSKLPVVSRTHRADLYEELYPKEYIPFRKFIFSRVSRIFSISKNGVQYLAKKYPLLKDKFELSRLGINISQTNAKLNGQNSNFTIVSCSSVYSVKRVDSIALLLKQFSKMYPEIQITWHHFGSGELFNDLKELIKEVPKNMNPILHGHIGNKDLIDWYTTNHVDLFINLSESEGIPVSIMEANSFGIPALATNVGGTSELVSEKSGWLVSKSFSDDEIIQALEEATKKQSLRKQKSDEAASICSELFDSEKNYSEFVEKLNSL